MLSPALPRADQDIVGLIFRSTSVFLIFGISLLNDLDYIFPVVGHRVGEVHQVIEVHRIIQGLYNIGYEFYIIKVRIVVLSFGI